MASPLPLLHVSLQQLLYSQLDKTKKLETVTLSDSHVADSLMYFMYQSNMLKSKTTQRLQDEGTGIISRLQDKCLLHSIHSNHVKSDDVRRFS